MGVFCGDVKKRILIFDSNQKLKVKYLQNLVPLWHPEYNLIG